MTDTVFTNIRTLRTEQDNSQLDRLARINVYGPVPINPFLRLRHNSNQSLVAMALSCRVDRKALARLEKGMYTTPLPSVVDYWVNLSRATEGELWSDYEDFQYNQRKRHPLFFGPSLYIDPQGAHPLRQLRANVPAMHDPNATSPVGITECAEALCLALDTLQFFEKKYRLQQTVPKTLKAVLSQIGYTREQINTFEREYKSWRLVNKPVSRS